MVRLFTMLVLATGLVGCAQQFSVPVTGQLADGTPAAGQATARTSGNGDFWVQVADGTKCSGTYNAYDTNPTIVVPVNCADGRSGQTIITRQLDGLSGTAIVTLDDGTRGQFVFGNLTFEQAYGSGGAKTNTVQKVQIVR